MRRPGSLALAALAALAAACGHRGDPLPPRRRTPPAPQAFRLAQRGDALEVGATAPTASVDGVAYASLTIEFLDAEGLQDLEKAGRRHAVRALPGSRVVQTLPLPAPGTTVRAAARSVAGEEKGQRTLTVTLVTQAPLEAPSELNVVLAEEGVALAWHGVRPPEVAAPVLSPKPMTPPGGGPRPPTPAPPKPTAPAPAQPAAPPAAPPEGAVAPSPAKAGGTASATAGAETPPEAAPALAGPRRHGFFVYRRLGRAAYGAPLVEEPLERRNLNDTVVPQGETACYVVRAVASTEPLIESAPSNEACVAVRDVAAPATPTGIAVLPREGGIEVLWTPSTEADLGGYRVYRTAPGGSPEKLADVSTTRASWIDETAERGVVYRYAVTALDQAGNESPPAEPVEASFP